MTSPRYRAVITDADYPDVSEQRAVLEAIGAELVWENLRTEDALIAGLAGADVLLTQYAPLTARVIASLDRCKGIVRYGVGYDSVDLAAATRRGIHVCNVPDYGTDVHPDGHGNGHAHPHVHRDAHAHPDPDGNRRCLCPTPSGHRADDPTLVRAAGRRGHRVDAAVHPDELAPAHSLRAPGQRGG